MKLLLSWRFSTTPLFSSAGSSWLLSHPRFLPFFFPLATAVDRVSVRTVASKLVTKPVLLNRPSGLSDYHLAGRAGWALPQQDRTPLSPLYSLFSFSPFNVSILPLHVELLRSWRFSAASLSSLAPMRPGCSLALVFLPSFSLFPPRRPCVSPNRGLKARHEADSFEPAEWSERLTSRRSGWLGAAAAGSSGPAFTTLFSLLFLFSQRQYSSSARENCGGAVANRLRRRTLDQTVLGSNPAVAVALSPWTRLFTPIVPRRSLHITFY